MKKDCHSLFSPPASFLIPQTPFLSISHPSTRCPQTFPPFPITWLPHPPSHLFPILSSVLQLPGLPSPPPHLHLIPSSVTYHIYCTGPLSLFSFQIVTVAMLVSCLVLLLLSFCHLNLYLPACLSESGGYCDLWTSSWHKHSLEPALYSYL